MLKLILSPLFLAVSFVFLTGLESQSWSSGEYLSKGDSEFLKDMVDLHSTRLDLANAVEFSVSKQIDPHDPSKIETGTFFGSRSLGENNLFFRKLLGKGQYSDSTVVQSNEPNQVIVKFTPIEIHGIRPDFFAKILRLIVTGKFDSFTSEQDYDGKLTAEFLMNANQYEVTDITSVLASLEIRDEASLGRAIYLLNEAADDKFGSTFKAIQDDLKDKVFKYYTKRTGCIASTVKGFVNCLSDEDLARFIPGLRVLVDPESIQRPGNCQDGYIRVPGNPTYGTGGFCLMKYEASNGGGGRAVSVINAMPWVIINRDAAAAACKLNGTGFDLASNTQWQIVARNVEDNSLNWNRGNGPIGTGTMSRGNSTSTSALAAAGDENPYFGLPTSQQNDWTHKRTHTLSNGEVIWDLAGNVWEWVLGNLTVGGDGWQEFNSQYFSAQSPNRDLFAPLRDLNSSHNAGKVYIGSAAGAVLRGGSWYNDTNAGVFAAALYLSAFDSDPYVGFRCAYALH